MGRRTRSGAAAAEFALTLPVLFLVMVGVIELSQFISRFHVVQRAARDGARVGSVTIEGVDGDGTQIEAAAVTQAITILEASGYPCSALCDVSADYALDGDYYFVTTTVSYPYEPFSGLAPLPATTPVVARFTMLAQQQ